MAGVSVGMHQRSGSRRASVCSIIHDHQTAARMLTPVTANPHPGGHRLREFSLGQARAAWYKAAPTAARVQQRRSLSPDHRPRDSPSRRVTHAPGLPPRARRARPARPACVSPPGAGSSRFLTNPGERESHGGFHEPGAHPRPTRSADPRSGPARPGRPRPQPRPGVGA